jgi:hypothetical protein
MRSGTVQTGSLQGLRQVEWGSFQTDHRWRSLLWPAMVAVAAAGRGTMVRQAGQRWRSPWSQTNARAAMVSHPRRGGAQPTNPSLLRRHVARPPATRQQRVRSLLLLQRPGLRGCIRLGLQARTQEAKWGHRAHAQTQSRTCCNANERCVRLPFHQERGTGCGSWGKRCSRDHASRQQAQVPTQRSSAGSHPTGTPRAPSHHIVSVGSAA